MGMCYNAALVRDKPLGSHTSVKRVYCERVKCCTYMGPSDVVRWNKTKCSADDELKNTIKNVFFFINISDQAVPTK